MVRLRKLGAEFHTPDQLRSGTLINMPYLTDMNAYQDYLDGDITGLFGRMAGNEEAQNVTGARFYAKAGPSGYWQLNLFRAYVRYLVAAVFDRSPVVLDDNPAVQAQWEEASPAMLRQARKAVEWFGAKGRGILMVQRRYPATNIPLVVDPKDYLPLVDPVDRDLTYGHMLLRLWFEGQRIQTTLPNRATVQIYIPQELADISDGRVIVQNTTEDFTWGGDVLGVVGGRLGDSVKASRENPRLQGLWSFGEDDSVFKTMERNVYELLISLSNSRTSLTRDIRPVRVEPTVNDAYSLDSSGRLILDLLDPSFRISVDSQTGANLGYLHSGGMDTSSAFLQLVEIALDNLAYVANIPREAFGLNMQANESGEALQKLQATFRTMVIDIRDDLATILSLMWPLLGGPTGVKIGWEHEPFASTKEYRDSVRADFTAGIVNREFAQASLGYPIMEVDNGNTERTGGSPSEDIDGRDDGESTGVEDGSDRDTDD